MFDKAMFFDELRASAVWFFFVFAGIADDYSRTSVLYSFGMGAMITGMFFPNARWNPILSIRDGINGNISNIDAAMSVVGQITGCLIGGFIIMLVVNKDGLQSDGTNDFVQTYGAQRYVAPNEELNAWFAEIIGASVILFCTAQMEKMGLNEGDRFFLRSLTNFMLHGSLALMLWPITSFGGGNFARTIASYSLADMTNDDLDADYANQMYIFICAPLVAIIHDHLAAKYIQPMVHSQNDWDRNEVKNEELEEPLTP